MTVLIVSVMFLGEKMTALQIIGAVLIMAGIFLLGMHKEESVEPVVQIVPEQS